MTQGPDFARWLFDNSRELMSVVGENGAVKVMNPAWTKALGWKLEDLLGGNCGSLIHPDDMAHVEAALVSLRASGFCEHEARLRGLDGQYRWFSVYNQAVEGDGYISVLRDITVERRHEAALKAAGRAREILAEAAGIGAWTFDPDTQHTSWGADFERIIGFDCDALPDLAALTERLHPDEREAVSEAFLHGVQDGARGSIQHRLLTADGQWITLQTTFRSEPAPNGAYALQCLSQNVTELAEALHAAEAANRAKTTFLATMSHEIRTPLNGVLGMAQAMAADDLSPVQAERLTVIRESGENLLAVLNDVLDLSKIEAGKLELEEIEFDLDHLLAGAYSTFTALANKKGLSFGLEKHEGARGVYLGDPTRLRQIIYNLISNAIKFTEAGEVRLVARSSPSGLQIVVSDTGIGIPPDRVATLFDKFTQADLSTTRRYGGTGLGLTICRDLAELMSGSIEVASDPGKGTTFTVTLPLERVGDAALGEVASTEAEEQVSAGELRVLAAEDNSVNQLVLKTLLHQMGVAVTVVDDGQKAVDAWMQGDWDVILMDVQMPIMDGPTATRLIRAQEAQAGRARTPIIALTSNTMTHQIAEYLEAGMDTCVAKPLQIGQLVEAMLQVTSEAPAEARSLAQAS